jgi:hypothetical protein
LDWDILLEKTINNDMLPHMDTIIGLMDFLKSLFYLF